MLGNTKLTNQRWQHMFGIRDIIPKMKLNNWNTSISATPKNSKFGKSCSLRKMKMFLWILIFPLEMIWSGSTAYGHQRSHKQPGTTEDKNNVLLETFLNLNTFLIQFTIYELGWIIFDLSADKWKWSEHSVGKTWSSWVCIVMRLLYKNSPVFSRAYSWSQEGWEWGVEKAPQWGTS